MDEKDAERERERERDRGTRRQRKCQRKGTNKVLERERYKEERDKKGSEAKRI
jgi:hypothetical protein